MPRGSTSSDNRTKHVPPVQVKLAVDRFGNSLESSRALMDRLLLKREDLSFWD